MGTLYENYAPASGWVARRTYSDHEACQTFTPQSSHTLSSASVYLLREGSTGISNCNAVLEIFAVDSSVPTGSALGSAAINVMNIDVVTIAWYDFAMPNTPVVSGTEYALAMRIDPQSGNANNNFHWYYKASGDYPRGVWSGRYGGYGWVTLTAADAMFKEYGYVERFGTVDNLFSGSKKVTKKLVAIANDELWWETSAGTMAEVSDATGHLNTNKVLDAFEGFGKLFIVNDTNLKVFDFTNIKAVTTDVGANPPDKGNILTGGTSSAKMIVDYITSLTSAMSIYGNKITTVSFSSGETVTGTDDDNNAISFTLSESQVTAPHWYDWTSYGNDSSYGSLPDQAGIGCLYRGRAVLAGDKDYPHQWYMARQSNPWDFDYTTNDAQSPVAGNNADLGEVGDIITALIPRKDDFLIIGCTQSMWVIRGDPAAGGSLDELSLSTGIFGKKAWCWDSEDNLYFWGKGGIYVISIGSTGASSPELITKYNLPKIVSDESINPSVHRITMEYDNIRHGILITITKISDGSNSNFWLDLRITDSEGNKVYSLFPEEYPTQAAVESLHFYNADDPDYRKLLIGGYDGYIRYFNNGSKVDDAGSTNGIISAYVTLGPYAMNPNSGKLGKLMETTVFPAGAKTGGTFGDSDSIDLKFYKGVTAESVLSDAIAGTAFLSVTAAPEKTKITKKIRGNYLAIKCATIASEETWSFEKIIGKVKPVKGEPQ